MTDDERALLAEVRSEAGLAWDAAVLALLGVAELAMRILARVTRPETADKGNR